MGKVPGIALHRVLLLYLFGSCLLGVGGCRQEKPGMPRESEANDPGRTAEHPSDLPVFKDVTREAGLDGFQHETGAAGGKRMPETYGAGAAFIDYDGDGWSDLLLVRGGRWPGDPKGNVPALQLYRNLGNGRFVDATQDAGLDACEAYGFGLAAADYDNDGDTDVFLTTLETNLFFRNDGARFSEIASEAGLAAHREWSTAALFFDANRDGWVDLYAGNYVQWTPETDIACTADGVSRDYCMPHQYTGLGARFYLNRGNGSFAERTRENGLADNPGKTLGIAELDYDRDGWPDLVVANDTHRNLLYRNRGDGTFEERGVVGGVAYDDHGRARAGMGIDIGEVDATGEPTVFIGNFSEEMVGVFRYTGNGIFRDRGPASGVGQASLSMLTFGVSLLDVELDGDLDLMLANGHIIERVERMQDGVTYRQPVQLFANDGAGRFERLQEKEPSVLQARYVARGLAYADYDRDGDLDVLITENGGPVHLWQNTTDPQLRPNVHLLRVELAGEASNRDAVGAKVEALVAGLPRQRRAVRTGGSYLSQSEKTLTFGLGAATHIDTLRIAWPSGRVETHVGLPADREVRIIEGQGLSFIDLKTGGLDPNVEP